MKKRKLRISALSQIIKKLAPKIGATVTMEPTWQEVGQIKFKNGRARYWRGNSLDLNTLGAVKISKDKGYTNFFLKRGGFPIVPGQTFFSNRWAKAIGSKNNLPAAYQYAKKLGFPVIVKPNNGSQGHGVSKVYTRAEFYQAMQDIFKHYSVALVQRPVIGKDYRIVVFDNEVITAYERIPFNITGNGRSTILQLLKSKKEDFITKPDIRIIQNLKRKKLTLQTVLEKNKTVHLLDNANLSSGGDGVDVSGIIHTDYKKIAVAITKYIGLRFCGVDLMVAGDISKPAGKYWVLETNGTPSLKNYLGLGKKQQQIVEDMYLKILGAMEK